MNSFPDFKDRKFRVWGYFQKTHSLLICSPHYIHLPKLKKNINIIFRDVSFFALPTAMDGLSFHHANAAESSRLSTRLNREVMASEVVIIDCDRRRFPVVSKKVEVIESEGDSSSAEILKDL